MDMANKLMKEIGLIDLYPDMITYFAMIKGFCNAGRLEDACELFQAMREQGFSPNASVYSVLLEGICMHGSTEKALEFLEEMETTGGSCSPNVITYTSVIKSFCEKGHTMEALRILDRMETCGCAPNRVTVITLIKGFCAEGHVEEAYKLIDKVAGRGVSDGDCYSALVVSLIRINRLDEAEILFRKMSASGAKPDGIACSLMIREICRKGRVLDGFCLYDEIEQMRFLSSIDSDIYSILLVGLCQQSHLVEAAKLARSMLDKRIRLKAIYVNKIIEHLKNSGDKELAIQLSRIARELKLIKIYFILLGAVPFPTDVPRLKENGVRGVITLNEPYETLVPTSLYHNYGINHLVIPTRDYYFAPSLTSICQAIDFIHRNVSLGQTTYVHCKAGRGRSTTIVLCYLVYYKQMTPVTAYDYVKLIRPRVRLAASQWQAVEEFYYLKMRKAGFHSYMMDLILRTSDLSPARDLVTFDDGSVVVVTEADLDGYDQSLESGAVGSTIWADLSMVYRVRVVGQAALARISCLWITCQAHQKISAKKLATESSCLGSTISVDIHVY